MCGRFTLTADTQAIVQAFPGFALPENYTPRYNIAPTQHIAVIPNDGKQRIALFRWGLVPAWAKDLKIGNRMINARAETVAEKPSFRAAYRRRRCLILADGFYEWQKVPGQKHKTPHYIRLKSGRPFAFAGLWEAWRPPEEENGKDERIYTCTIITTTPNELMAPLHDRMPVIIPPSAYERWLATEEQHPDQLGNLLQPYSADVMTHYPVSHMVNSPATDHPGCILPVAI